MAEVLYIRTPDSLKEAVDAYAEQRGVTLTSAVVDLIERGLAATTDERSVADLEKSLARVIAEKSGVEAHLVAATSELGALRSVVERSQAVVGSCPNNACGQHITGYELLALGHCQVCREPLTDLLAPSRQPTTLDQRAVGVLLGALGVALIGVGIAGIAGK